MKPSPSAPSGAWRSFRNAKAVTSSLGAIRDSIDFNAGDIQYGQLDGLRDLVAGTLCRCVWLMVAVAEDFGVALTDHGELGVLIVSLDMLARLT